MTEYANGRAGDCERGVEAITLQNAMSDLSRLADDLSEVARLFDQASADDVACRPTIETMAPREFFASLLVLRRTRDRHPHIERLGGETLDIVLQLMLARIDEREPKLSELADNSSSPPQATRRWVEQLIDAGLAERFAGSAERDDFSLSLAEEAALRLAELYRTHTRR
jgi:hypothetical protein